MVIFDTSIEIFSQKHEYKIIPFNKKLMDFIFSKMWKAQNHRNISLQKYKQVFLCQELYKTNIANLMSNFVLGEKEGWVIGKISLPDDIFGAV